MLTFKEFLKENALRRIKNKIGHNLPDTIRKRLPGLPMLGRSIATKNTKLKKRAIDTLKGKHKAPNNSQMTKKNRLEEH